MRRIKSIGSIIILSCIGLCMAGCSSVDVAGDESSNNTGIFESVESNIAEEVVAEGNDETIETSETTEPNEATEPSEMSDTNERIEEVNDGIYYAELYSDGKDRIGIADEWGNLPGIAYKVQVEGNKMIVSGSMWYSATADYENSVTSDDMDHAFAFDDSTEFKWIAGPDDAEKYSAEDYVCCLQDLKDTGLCLSIKVENGVATEVSVSS